MTDLPPPFVPHDSTDAVQRERQKNREASDAQPGAPATTPQDGKDEIAPENHPPEEHNR